MLEENVNTDILSVLTTGIQDYKTDINSLLVDTAWYSIRKIVSSMIVLRNSFFTVFDKNLVVLKTYLNKNSDKSLIEKTLCDGTSLLEPQYRKSSTYLSYTTGKTAFLNKEKHINNKSPFSISTPIKLKSEIIGYITLSTKPFSGDELLGIFLESLALNIENRIIYCHLMGKLKDYITISKKSNKEIAFSYQEQRIVNYIKDGSSIEKMAMDFYVSEATIKTYLKRIYSKCGTSNRADTAIFLVCTDLINQVK